MASNDFPEARPALNFTQLRDTLARAEAQLDRLESALDPATADALRRRIARARRELGWLKAHGVRDAPGDIGPFWTKLLDSGDGEAPPSP